MDITGIVKEIGIAQQVSDKFRKRDIVITDNSTQYPQHLSFQLTQDKCSLADSVKVGDEIKVHFNLRGREWKSPQGEVKHFNTLEAWEIDSVSKGNNITNNDIANENAAGGDFIPTSSSEDDLPF